MMKPKVTHLLVISFMLIFALLTGSDLTAAETAQEKEKKEEKKKDEKKKEEVLHYEVTVTATRTKKDTFETPKPVSVVNRQTIEEKAPNNVTDLLTELPGVDVNGVGANQSRPVVRGFRGQRILLMEDGIRMNNSRRQQDFGEIPGMVDISQVEQVEVVRGPASVLYGSDAIGGVVNIITRQPRHALEGSEVHGNLGYRYSSAEKQNKGAVNLNGHIGRLGFMFGGNMRKANDYTAPAGTFGPYTLAEDAPVVNSGVKDHGYNLQLSYNFSENNQISFKYDYYEAENAGFGLVEPDLIDNDDEKDARVDIGYPFQKVNKYSLKYEARKLKSFLADHISFTAYHRANERELSMNVFIPFNLWFAPDAGIDLLTENYTDVNTVGFRLELNKAVKNHVLTYGADMFLDNSENTDNSTTTVLGFGPPHPMVDTTPQLPFARYRSMGVFIQDDISLFGRTSLILGVRYQNVNAKTKRTAGLEDQPLVDSTDQTVVGTANLIYGVTENLRLVFSVGRGFRSPNLIERFFHGLTPEGSGFQERNTALTAETSLNFDVGFKYRTKNIYLESTVFNNVIYDGISLWDTGKFVNDDPEMPPIYQNINVDKLRTRGIEAMGKIYLNMGLSFMANYTYLKSKDLSRPETPYVDTYSSKFNFNTRYDDSKKRFYLAYHLRVNGKQKDVLLDRTDYEGGIPGFTVHSFSAGVTLFKNSPFPQQVGIVIRNFTNELYAEFSNASFFRPAPKTHVVLTWNAKF
ncbi:MAG: TonB-dependent receptor, partial [bacterium]|nr:TonB-dependent receptor [bacterium]